jgi:hypothetical protein
VNDTIVELDERLMYVEDDLYNKESRNDRLTRLESRINDCKLNLSLHIADKEAQMLDFQNQIKESDLRGEVIGKRFNVNESLVLETRK